MTRGLLTVVGRRGRVLAAALLCHAVLVASAASPARADTEWITNALDREAGPAEPQRAAPRDGKSRAPVKASPGTPDAAAAPKHPGVVAALVPLIGQHTAPHGKGPLIWRIRHATWSEAHEQAFEAFVAGIGESDCANVHDCLTDPRANPRYHAHNPPGMRFAADCADLPYLLRAYFAWMNELPFSHSSVVTQRTSAGGARLAGNQIIGRMDIVGPGPEPRQALTRIAQLVSSEHFRVPPAQAGPMLPDHYPVRISRESIRPGTMIFDPDGHVAVVTKVGADGLIHYIDAHPDNTLTRGIYGREFTRTAPEMGAGFKRWRPIELKGATRRTDGLLAGGAIVQTPDSALADWSDEQFFGTAQHKLASRGRRLPVGWARARFEIDGEALDYYDFVRVRLAGPGFKYDPVAETRTLMRTLCTDLGYRVIAVDAAIRAGIHLQPQPQRLPANIYATDGDWERYATPSRDARLKTAFEELRDEIERFLKLRETGSARLAYDGDDLVRDLADVYREEAAACSIRYTRSNGESQTLGFEEVRQRLFKLSFDPYHCIELRWGASEPDELASCRDRVDKRTWYKAEDRLRNQITRTYGEKMGWTLAELQRRDLAIGIDEEPDVDVPKLLAAWGKPKVAAVPLARQGRRR